MNAAAPALELDRVRREFTGHLAVDDVSLSVRQGEFVTLLGPSGCGKTTILRMVAGFEQPTSGIIKVGGKPVAGVPPYRRPIGIVFQNLALFPHMTVAGNVAFGLEVMKLPREEIRKRVSDVLALIGLPELGDRRVNQISGGQRQRVALARALVTRPTVLLLDEPLSALDLKIRKQLQSELKRIQRQVGTTFVFVTHDQEEALTMSDRIAVMDRGRIEQLSTPSEIYSRPKSAFVARFIGDTNLLTGRISEVVGDYAKVAIDGVDTTAEAPLENGEFSVGMPASIVIRPENVRIVDDTAGPNKVRGMIEEATYSGSYIRVRLRANDVELILNAPSSPANQAALSAGQNIVVSWNSADSVLQKL